MAQCFPLQCLPVTSPQSTLPFHVAISPPTMSVNNNSTSTYQNLPAMSLSIMLPFYSTDSPQLISACNISPSTFAILQQTFSTISSSTVSPCNLLLPFSHAISCHPLPFNHVQSSVIVIVHVELTYHKDEWFISDIDSNMETLLITILELDRGEGEWRWWSRAIHLLQQHISPQDIIPCLPTCNVLLFCLLPTSQVVQFEIIHLELKHHQYKLFMINTLTQQLCWSLFWSCT